jgi:hypothetical protein
MKVISCRGTSEFCNEMVMQHPVEGERGERERDQLTRNESSNEIEDDGGFV